MRPEVRGVCPDCSAANSYIATSCSSCGTRLPWADTVYKAVLAPAQENVPESTTSQVAAPQISAPASRDRPSFGYAFQGFLFPVIGLILYLVFRADTPLRARSAGRGALSGFVVQALIAIVLLMNI